MDIKRIVTKGASGYGPLNEAYEDKLTMTSDSISYEYKPHPESKCDTNIYKKWRYKTTSPLFKELYHQVSGMLPKYLYSEDILFATDIGSTEITAIFEDGHREKTNYCCPSEYFAEWFRVIKQMVPACEYTPAVLLTNEDYEQEE